LMIHPHIVLSSSLFHHASTFNTFTSFKTLIPILLYIYQVYVLKVCANTEKNLNYKFYYVC
jgi:hypothetical protein